MAATRRSIELSCRCMVNKTNPHLSLCHICNERRSIPSIIHLSHTDLDSHLIEKTQNKLTVSGTFDPQSLVIRVRAATNRRVEILQATELSSATAPPGDTAAMRNQGDNVRYTSDGDSSCTTSKKKKKKKKKKRLNAA